METKKGVYFYSDCVPVDVNITLRVMAKLVVQPGEPAAGGPPYPTSYEVDDVAIILPEYATGANAIEDYVKELCRAEMDCMDLLKNRAGDEK